MVDSLKGGQQEGIDFIFLSNKCQTFKDVFGAGMEKVQFDADWWNQQFDNPEENVIGTERGFVNGHHNLGWGRCGVNENTHVSQMKSLCFLLALPHMTNKSTQGACQKLGNIPDLVQSFCNESTESWHKIWRQLVPPQVSYNFQNWHFQY